MRWIYRYFKTKFRSNAWDIPIENLDRVKPHVLYRGGYPSAEALAMLKSKCGVTDVLCLLWDGDPKQAALVEKEWEECSRLGIRFHWTPLNDKGTPDLNLIVENVEMIAPSLGLDDSRIFYVHCMGGRHRTGLQVTAIRHIVDFWSSRRSYQEAIAHGMYAERGHEAWDHAARYYDFRTRMLDPPEQEPNK